VPHARHFAQRIDDRLRPAKTDHLGFDGSAGEPLDFDDRPDRRRKSGYCRGQAFRADDTPGNGRRQDRVELWKCQCHRESAEQLLRDAGELGFQLLIERTELRIDAAAAGRNRRIEPVGAPGERHEHVLRDVFGGFFRPEHLPAEAVNRSMVPAENDGQRLAIARRHAFEQFRV